MLVAVDKLFQKRVGPIGMFGEKDVVARAGMVALFEADAALVPPFFSTRLCPPLKRFGLVRVDQLGSLRHDLPVDPCRRLRRLRSRHLDGQRVDN